MYNSIEESLIKLQDTINQDLKKTNRNNQTQSYNKELKKIKNYINNNQFSLTEEQRKNLNTKQNNIKGLIQKAKPAASLLKPEERAEYRLQITNCLKTIQKKLNALNEKKDQKKDNKKRQTNIQFFKFHMTKLAQLNDWLQSSTKKFSSQQMKILLKYSNDIHISQDDSVFHDELKEIYEKIFYFAEQSQQINYQLFFSSYANQPKVNDYLPPKQTKQNSYRSSICPTYKMIDLSVIPKMPKQLLFFMFYMHKGETQQYLAARDLMRRSWRYYTRFHMWIRRCQPPNFNSQQDYQTGNYYTMGTQLIIRERRGIKINLKHLINHLGTKGP